MKKNLGLLLAVVMVMNLVSTLAYAWENPLQKYNLYEDTHPKSSDERESAMSEFYQNSLSNKMNQRNRANAQKNSKTDQNAEAENEAVPTKALDYALQNYNPQDNTKTRNQKLRESSRKVFADPAETPGWLEGPSFYPNPTLDSIKEKYRRSDFAGCMQECTSYVRKYPNDTLGFYYLAMCYTKVSDKDNAIKAYERVIALNDNPMIVKYATNGRNCVMNNANEECFMNVNEPELLHPYEGLGELDLTPVDPQTLINRNLNTLRNKLSVPSAAGEDANAATKDGITLPFGNQDSSLDAFIDAPYGNGLSPELNTEYKQLQLRKIQKSINRNEETGDKEKKKEELDAIKKFDKIKSDSDTIKLAYDPSALDIESIAKDPDYIRQQQEINEINMLFGNDSKDNHDLTDLLPYMTESNKKLSPEVIQTLMMKSMMGNITL